ncbi:MAG: hypothetical protein HFI67_08615 [Lachnospiraceae bacterium]|nr:hypothetical protein [Lachnospiraceae bacterium]
MEKRENILYVQMFNGFSLEWNGKKVLKERERESQVSRLLQMILHERRNGALREEIKGVLFEERELENSNHALQSVIYNAKKKLKAAGLPSGFNYIRREGERYHWTEKISVVEDAGEMERIFAEAEEETDSGKKLKRYLEACYTYTGEFLGSAADNILWAVQEAKKYHCLFCVSTERAAALLRERGDYEKMEELGLYASRVDSLANWETVTMEALVAAGRHQEAKRLYNDTVELYHRELGVSPSGSLQDLMGGLGRKMEHGYSVLEQIQEELSREERPNPGGYLCPYPVFTGIYQIMRRLMERSGQSVFLMLCTIMDGKGNPMKEGPKLDELAKKLEEAACRAVRRCDTVNRYGRGQYLILLTNTTREDCILVQKRIDREFMEKRQRIHVQYHVSSVTDATDRLPEAGKRD